MQSQVLDFGISCGMCHSLLPRHVEGDRQEMEAPASAQLIAIKRWWSLQGEVVCADLHPIISANGGLPGSRLHWGLFIGKALYSFNFSFLLIQALAPEENSLGWL